MIQEVIVVEGKNDTRRLQSFFDVDTFETDGLALNKEKIELIRKLNEKRGVILFLDPDSPGEKIRQRLNSEIAGLKNAFVISKEARTSKKVGIEHASKEVLEEALNNLITYGNCKDSLTKEEFYELGLGGEADSAVKRAKVAKAFHLGECNGKTMFKRINMLGISYNDIKEIL